MNTEQSDIAETARQLAETCSHGVPVLDGPVCTECEQEIPAGTEFSLCPGCDAPRAGDRCRCCSDCRHGLVPTGKRFVFVWTASGRRMTDMVDR